MMKCKILSTKKLEPLLIKQAKEKGFDIIEQEFISIQSSVSEEKIKYTAERIKSGIEYIAFTSSNAVTILKALLQKHNFINSLKTFCLSGKTKETVIEVGFPEENIIAFANDATALAKEIIGAKVSEVIFFCGKQRRDELPETLRSAGIKVHEVVVYDTIETAKKITDDFNALLFFSPSAVKSFFSLNQIKETTICFAIGQTTADSIAGYTNNKIITSSNPDQEMMIVSVQNYFQNIKCFE